MRSYTPALLGLLPNALAYSFSDGSIAAGNLSLSAPWELDPSKYKSAISKPDDSAAFNISGYNTSSSAPSPQSVGGWKLEAHVKHDVSLSSTSNSTLDKSNVFQATTLYIDAPDDMTMDDSWRVCAVVWPGTASNVSEGTDVDGSCGNVLSSACVQALVVASTGSSNGLSNSGECTSMSLPSRCSGDFPDGTGNVSSIAINQTVLDQKSFYAFGSTPGSKDDTAAQDEAKLNVWPVLMIYGHLSSGGQLSSTNAAVQCVRAVNGTTSTESAAVKLALGSSTMAVVGAFIVSGLLLMS